MNYNYLFLDADGTLLDFKAAQNAALSSTFICHGISVSNEILEIYDKINQEVWQALERKELDRNELVQVRFKRLFSEFGITNIDISEFNNGYIHNLSNECALLDGALDLLKELSKHYPMSIITNGKTSTQYKRLSGSGIDVFFEHIIISEEIGREKPDPLFFSKALEIAKQSKENVLIIGDSLTADIQGGINAGIDTCWYNPNHLTTPDDIRPLFTVNRLSDITGLLEINTVTA